MTTEHGILSSCALLRRPASPVLPPAFERRFIALSRPRTGIVAGQTSFPEVAHCGTEGLIAECPLWVKSRHGAAKSRCPLYPQKRTSGVTPSLGGAAWDYFKTRSRRRPRLLVDRVTGDPP